MYMYIIYIKYICICIYNLNKTKIINLVMLKNVIILLIRINTKQLLFLFKLYVK